MAASFAGCLDWNALYGTRCGDGTVDPGESCDDGNTLSNDGCSALCTIEVPHCGDGLTTKPEECDDANTDEDDACLNDCHAAHCGDGHVWISLEDCDDRNHVDGDGCSAGCQLETDLCGNNLKEGLEECDDGNRVDGDGCSATCKREPAPELCGNSRRDPNEACDDGNSANDDACLNGCSLAACGDGFVWHGVEQCDDGNTDNDDGCTRTCLACHTDGSFFRTANGHCYALHPEQRTFAEATDLCDAAGGHVWTTTNTAEMREINRTLVKSEAPTWIGFRTTPPAGWVTGEPVSFQAWAPGEPIATTSGCVVQVADATFSALWRSEPCSDRYQFVCETMAPLVFATTHHAYVLHTRTRSWLEARDTCAAAGGSLVSIETADEQAFMAEHFSIEVWLGATRGPGGAFQWLSGAPLDFTSYARGQPDNAGGSENCLVLNRFGSWADIDCASSRRFVCEFE